MRFGDFIDFDFGGDYGILVGGALHWIRYQRDLEQTIVAFDLTKEEFNFVPRPELLGNFTLTYLENYQGCLCLFCESDEEADSSIVWVMKELGIKESWTKQLVNSFEVQNYRIKLSKIGGRSNFVDYDFGYDSATDDYKVIRLITAHTDGITDSSVVELYSLKSDSWKRFEALVGYSFCIGYCILVGGALHWLRYKPYDLEYREYIIVSFDLTKEEFNFVPHPELSSKFTSMNLGNYQGCLSLFCHADEAADSEIWVIKETWTKVFIVNNTYTYMRAIYHSMCKTTNFWGKNRDTLEWNKE
ncbi:F-box protein CPR30 [Abeliophyllum distichum]|uniref:F-box protein CPR30 n=1 Tax=Abeliophyllum distichum TaxID=126358 RepID=A0ABD1QHP2_9LAMI